MRRVIVAGGLGFIGSNFIINLLRDNSDLQVINYDKMTYAGNPMNLQHIADDPRYQFVRGDAADSAAVDKLLAAGEVDCLVNFVAESHVDRSIQSSAPFVHSNFVGTQVLLDAARKHGIPRFVQVSTDEVYGSLGEQGAFSEDSPIQPNNPYSATKAAADMLCRAYFKTHGMPVLITRCSNNYGPRQFPEKLIPLLINRAIDNRTIPVYGDGQQIRDWLHVDDHCAAIWAVADRGVPGEIYNIGGDCELKNLDLVRLLLDRLDKSHELIEFVEDRPGHDRRYAMNAGKIRSELDWKPAIGFEDGIGQTIEWYLSNQNWLAAIADGTYQSVK